MSVPINSDGVADMTALSEATLYALRNQAVAHGETRVADGIQAIIDAQASPDLYRHSRRRQR